MVFVKYLQQKSKSPLLKSQCATGQGLRGHLKTGIERVTKAGSPTPLLVFQVLLDEEIQHAKVSKKSICQIPGPRHLPPGFDRKGSFGGLFFLLLPPRPQHRCPRKVLPLRSPLLCPFVSLSPFPSLSFVYLFFLPAYFLSNLFVCFFGRPALLLHPPLSVVCRARQCPLIFTRGLHHLCRPQLLIPWGRSKSTFPPQPEKSCARSPGRRPIIIILLQQQ